MTPDDNGVPERSYGCTFGDGNPYDFIMVNVADQSTEFLCAPCLVALTARMLEALNSPENAQVQEAMAYRLATGMPQVPGPSGKRGRRNAPAGTDDPDLFAAYDSRVDLDDLPEEFRSP